MMNLKEIIIIIGKALLDIADAIDNDDDKKKDWTPSGVDNTVITTVSLEP